MMYTNFMYQKLTTRFYSFIGYYKTKSCNELFFPCAPILTGDNFNFLLINLFSLWKVFNLASLYFLKTGKEHEVRYKLQVLFSFESLRNPQSPREVNLEVQMLLPLDNPCNWLSSVCQVMEVISSYVFSLQLFWI